MATGLVTKRAEPATKRAVAAARRVEDTPGAPIQDAPGSPVGPRPYLLTSAQFRTIVEAGVFGPNDRVELLGGRLIEKMSKYPRHSFGVDSIAALLRAILGDAWSVREEKAIELDDFSRHEPDVVVARGPRETYRGRDPIPKDIALIVEVSDSSYSDDRGEKWVRYAAAKVPAYAILNIPAGRFELYTKPTGRGPAARYREVAMFGDSEAMPVAIAGHEVGRIAVRDVLP